MNAFRLPSSGSLKLRLEHKLPENPNPALEVVVKQLGLALGNQLGDTIITGDELGRVIFEKIQDLRRAGILMDVHVDHVYTMLRSWIRLVIVDDSAQRLAWDTLQSYRGG